MARYSRDGGDTSSHIDEEERPSILELMQLEALVGGRIQTMRTADYKENKRAFVPSAFITRRVDDVGTEENRAAQGEGGRNLTAWNTAWTALQDDGTAAEDLGAVNEGLGQTHRGRLQADDSVRNYTGDESYFRGGYGGRRGGNYGGRGGGRGGGFAGRGQGGGRQANTNRPMPVKRTRVVRGSDSKHVSSDQSSMKPKTASGIQPITPASLRRSLSTLKEVPIPKAAVSTRSLQQAATRSTKLSDTKSLEKTAKYEGILATPDDFMAKVLRSKAPSVTTSRASEPKGHDVGPEAVAITLGRGVTKIRDVPIKITSIDAQDPDPPGPALKHVAQTAVVDSANRTTSATLSPTQYDLMDVDISVEASPQTVIEFTHLVDSEAPKDPSARSPNIDQQIPSNEGHPLLMQNIEALQRLGGLSTEQLDLLQTLKAQIQSRASTQAREPPAPKVDAKATIVEPKAHAEQQNIALPVSQAVVIPSSRAVARESTAKKLVSQRNVLIGEHVHRTRFQHAALREKFQDLNIAGQPSSTPAELNTDGLATSNPFGPSRPLATGPSLPAHLANNAAVTDLGAAVRAQYNPSNAAKRDRATTQARTGPSLPAHLASLPPVVDAGAAARTQYNSADITSRGRGILNPISNGYLRSFPSSDSETSAASTTTAPRTSMLNRTGFIGLAESQEKGDDPLLVARKRGM